VEIEKQIQVVQADDDPFDANCAACAFAAARNRAAHVAVPLRVGNRLIGCFCVSSALPRRFTEREIHLVKGFSDQAALAIRNAQKYDPTGSRAVVGERERLAREMHDTLAQVLGFVNVKGQTLRELLDQGRTADAVEQLDQLTDLSQQLYADVREAILGLRTGVSPEKSLLPALAEYVQAYAAQSGIDARLVVRDGAGDLDLAPAVELQLIRIVQESLTNIRKHAQARHAVVRFSRVDGQVQMQIEDDGCGFDPAHIPRGARPQFGLQSMRERAESVGCTFAVISRPGAGAQVRVGVPSRHWGGS
jgi:signal transduction histidine kinase